jgi:hypothetical protein
MISMTQDTVHGFVQDWGRSYAPWVPGSYDPDIKQGFYPGSVSAAGYTITIRPCERSGGRSLAARCSCGEEMLDRPLGDQPARHFAVHDPDAARQVLVYSDDATGELWLAEDAEEITAGVPVADPQPHGFTQAARDFLAAPPPLRPLPRLCQPQACYWPFGGRLTWMYTGVSRRTGRPLRPTDEASVFIWGPPGSAR